MNKVIEDYTMLEKVGQGQYGNVYKAENRKNKQFYAIKVMNVQKFKHTPKLSQFTNNEIAILTKINHPNIIKFVEMLRTANNYYLVYEFCNGGTLAELIKEKKRLPQEEALKIFEQLKSAFEILNKQNILHRDLKPTNILFHNGVIKLADFGFCKELLKETDMTQTMVGSPIYMAPEVLKGLIYDSRADIWSLGVILYEMLYGFCPYEQSSIPKLISMIDNANLKFPTDVPISDPIKLLLKRMLTIKYRERISPAEFIKYSLDFNNKSSEKSQFSMNLRDVVKFIRRVLFYLAQTLDLLSEYVDDSKYLQVTFLVFKILNSIQKDTTKASLYWQIIKVPNTEEKWDLVCSNESKTLSAFGEIIKEALSKSDPSMKAKLQLETNYIDPKYFIELALEVSEPQIKVRLYNCLLFSKHFISVLQKKPYEFVDYSVSKKTLQEKEEMCIKYTRYF